MKKFICLSILCLSSYVWAQTPTPTTGRHLSDAELTQVTGIANYNATFIGYALSCKFDSTTVEKVNNYFFSLLDYTQISPEQYQLINQSYLTTAKTANEKGPANSNMTCDQFKVEWDKIVASIATKTDPLVSGKK